MLNHHAHQKSAISKLWCPYILRVGHTIYRSVHFSLFTEYRIVRQSSIEFFGPSGTENDCPKNSGSGVLAIEFIVGELPKS